MKIRTDFVTNSSSSSFIAYKLDLGILNKVVTENGRPKIEFGDRQEQLGLYTYMKDDFVTISHDNGEGPSMTLQELLAMALVKDDYNSSDSINAPGYSDLGAYGTNNKAAKNKADYKDYNVKNKIGDSDEEVVRFVKEMAENTNWFEEMIVEEALYAGGSEYDSGPMFGNFNSSGEYIVKAKDGRITEYNAHPNVGGYEYDESAFAAISYENGSLSILDRISENDDMGYDYDEDVIWSDSDVQEVINELADTKRTVFGITEIERFMCSELTKIVLPESCAKLDSGAFTDCPNLKQICLNCKNMELSDGCIPEGVELSVVPGGSVEEYCKSNGIKYSCI